MYADLAYLVHTGSGSLLGSKSASLPGGSTISADKSFDEMRFEHFHESPDDCPATLDGVEGGCLPLRLLWILGRVLACESIRSTVVDLVSMYCTDHNQRRWSPSPVYA